MNETPLTQDVATHRDRPSMSPEAQRIAIAEACGWKPASEARKYWTPPESWEYRINRDEQGIPKWFSDLNAMHEAEATIFPRPITDTKFTLKAWFGASDKEIPKSLDRNKLQEEKKQYESEKDNQKRMRLWVRYEAILGSISNRIHATAAQRAEAFLRTLNLWTENEASPVSSPTTESTEESRSHKLHKIGYVDTPRNRRTGALSGSEPKRKAVTAW